MLAYWIDENNGQMQPTHVAIGLWWSWRILVHVCACLFSLSCFWDLKLFIRLWGEPIKPFKTSIHEGNNHELILIVIPNGSKWSLFVCFFSDTAQFCLQQSPCLEQLETWQSQAQRVAEIEANIAQKEKAREAAHRRRISKVRCVGALIRSLTSLFTSLPSGYLT